MLASSGVLAGHHQLACLHHARVSLLGIVRHQDVVGLPWLEVITGLYHKCWVIDCKAELSGLCEDVLELDASARAWLDGEGSLWLGREAVAMERNGVLSTGRGGDGEGGVGVS